jgi:ACT domain-containing protein
MNNSDEILLLPETAGTDGEGKKYASASDLKQTRLKELMIEQLKKIPVIQICCEKLDISRSSYYRWRADDEKFAEDCDKALAEGCELVNDMAESQLLSAIRDQNLTAVIFWLRNHHAKYRNKVEVTATLKNLNQKVTEEQWEIVKKGMEYVTFQDDSSVPLKETVYDRKPNEQSSGSGNSAPGIAGDSQERSGNPDGTGPV